MARNFMSTTAPITPVVQTSGSIPWRERPLLPLKTASEVAGVSPSSLYRFSDEGRLKLRELAGRTLVDTQSLIALIDSAADWSPRNRGAEARARRKEIASANFR